MTPDSEHSGEAIDGTRFYESENLHTIFYDQLYGSSASQYGDIPWYEALAGQGEGIILDAACGTGRVFSGLIKPGRRLFAFDNSETMLASARERAHEARATCKVNITKQRLDTFNYDEQFDLILLSYYRFNHLTNTASRARCLQNIASHLKPGGKAVLHMPAPKLLSREVSEAELKTMRARHILTLRQQPGFVLELGVTSMVYEPQLKIRSMDMQASLTDPKGTQLSIETTALYYACITAQDLRMEAAAAGLAPKSLHTGFKPGVETEFVAVLEHR